MDVLVSYDIAGTENREGAARLRRVAKICERYGERVQHSVFECRLSPERLARLVGEVQDVIDRNRDSVIFYRLAGGFEDTRHRIGRSPDHTVGAPWIL